MGLVAAALHLTFLVCLYVDMLFMAGLEQCLLSFAFHRSRLSGVHSAAPPDGANVQRVKLKTLMKIIILYVAGGKAEMMTRRRSGKNISFHNLTEL